MGIKSLSHFLKTKYPNLFQTIHLSHFRFKKVAIDTSLYLCNYKALYGEEGWLKAFVKLVSVLRENEVHCIFIYDSGYPPEKEAEKKERMEDRKKLEERVNRLEHAIEKYHLSGEVDQLLIDFSEKKKIHSNNLLRPNNKNININVIELTVKKMRKQLFSINANDFITTKTLFDILDVPYFHAPLEAETTCADLCIQLQVDAVVSEDTDVLAYGAPLFLTKINTADGTCIAIEYKQVLQEMELSHEQFLDFCIMCGTDYNKNIFKIGPGKALKLIQKYKTIENIKEQENIDVSILNHIRGRELFRNYKKTELKVKYCGIPNFEKLKIFMFKKNCHINIDALVKSFTQNILIFEEN